MVEYPTRQGGLATITPSIVESFVEVRRIEAAALVNGRCKAIPATFVLSDCHCYGEWGTVEHPGRGAGEGERRSSNRVRERGREWW